MSQYTIQSCNAKEYEKFLAQIEKKATSFRPFLQAPFYGRLQEKTGKKVVFFTVLKANQPYGAGLAVRYAAPGGLSFLYCPYGPLVVEWSEDLWQAFHDFFAPLARDLGCAFVRFDNDEVVRSSVAKAIPGKIARTASLQPRAEWVLDISAEDESLWMQFHKHARYNVRLAERADAKVTVYNPSQAPLETFYDLMKTTSHRDGFGIFDLAYYESYLKTLADDEGYVVLVTIDGKPAAVGLFVVYDQQAHYVFAGSSNDFRKIAPAYTVIWSAIQEAKKRDATLFNFGGVTDEVKGHDLGGVTGFKKRFGGQLVEHTNPIDFVYKPLHYYLFKLYKTLQ